MEPVSRHKDEFSVDALVDKENLRIWIQDYRVKDPLLFSQYLTRWAKEESLEKIILPAREEDLKSFQENGFVLEGVIEAYYPDSKGYFLSAYPCIRRGKSLFLQEEQAMLKKILSQPRLTKGCLPEEFLLRRATKQDINRMADLFRQVFATYPTPIYTPRYLNCAMEKGDLYMVVYHGQQLVGAAAAEIDRDYGRTELTNCATHPDYRGLGLNTLLLKELEQCCLNRHPRCLYSLARSSSYGMNLILHRLGYRFQGTLINNCHIAGRFENMNLWVKPGLRI
ncbi:putative beta-lysine N-acetyltransferase [Desulforamulus ruminis]|uniref:GCN5-related N-acetyltransferase n=1 Tax=Desulforamulus ruminis (strain ATCC 23193 / DSM 2154 / NCIMB 8452 / DL) TaxID=696281 RepID=F6DNK6_DESRL|nr:putative beta-lysine N-acetyltransferase [Desulforamulus ruminis]AEG58546.1 GCN5-related N-acetyltransferase [Desulforamulus ruminis DSM 2154]